jgi:ribosomal protein S14
MYSFFEMIKHFKVNNLQRKFVKKTELAILLFKNFISSSSFIKNETVYRYMLKDILLHLNSFSSRARTNSVCVLTGRTRAVYRKTFKLTRMQIKEKSNAGLIPGIKKSSW